MSMECTVKFSLFMVDFLSFSKKEKKFFFYFIHFVDETQK